MSTKIYNGYRCRALTLQTQQKFIKELQEKIVEKYTEKYCKLYAHNIEDFLDTLVPFDAKGDIDNLKEVLVTRYKYQISPVRLIDLAIHPEKLDDESILERLQSPYTNLYNFIRDVMEANMARAEIKKDIFSCEFDFTAEIVFYPISTRYTLFTTYSDRFTRLFNEILDNDSEFVEKYGLEEYHYQNQTDRPEEISSRNWNKRKKDWDKALPTGLPSKDGVCVNLMDSEQFRIRTMFSIAFDDITKYFKPVSKRIEKCANEQAFERYWEKYKVDNEVDSNNYSAVISASNEFKRKLKEEDAYCTKLLEDQKEFYSKIIKEIDKETTLKQQILEYFPNLK